VAERRATAVGPGERAPAFSLPDTEGRDHAPGNAPATVVVFTCNHCPYALAWHDRIAAVAADYAGRGVRTLAVNSNDGERYPADSADAMRERVRDEGWAFPYLHDASQEVAAAYGATRTPEVFLLDGDGVVRYHGAPDGDYDDPGHHGRFLREALDDLLAGGDVRRPASEPVGCTIKWRP
jgi:peroxiredoxin